MRRSAGPALKDTELPERCRRFLIRLQADPLTGIGMVLCFLKVLVFSCLKSIIQHKNGGQKSMLSWQVLEHLQMLTISQLHIQRERAVTKMMAEFR